MLHATPAQAGACVAATLSKLHAASEADAHGGDDERAFVEACTAMAKHLSGVEQAALLRALLDAGARDVARPEDLALVSRLQQQMSRDSAVAAEEAKLAKRREAEARRRERDAMDREEGLHDQIEALRAQLREFENFRELWMASLRAEFQGKFAEEAFKTQSALAQHADEEKGSARMRSQLQAAEEEKQEAAMKARRAEEAAAQATMESKEKQIMHDAQELARLRAELAALQEMETAEAQELAVLRAHAVDMATQLKEAKADEEAAVEIMNSLQA